MTLDRVRAIQEYLQPSTQRELKQFLGLINFYHCFITGCANFLQPLDSLLSDDAKKNGPLAWMDDSTKAFEGSKHALANVSLLYHPQPNALHASSRTPQMLALEQCGNNGSKPSGVPLPTFQRS